MCYTFYTANQIPRPNKFIRTVILFMVRTWDW